MDVRENSSLGDSDMPEELVELLVVADGELDEPWGDTGALVVLGGVSGELEQLGGQVLEDGGEVDRRSRTDTLGETSLAEESSHAADGELQTCPGGPRRGSLLSLAATLALGEDHLEISWFLCFYLKLLECYST